MTDYHLILTEAHHGDDEFYDLGPVPTEVPPKDLWERLPTEPPHVCADEGVCWLVDLWTEEGNIDSREVDEATARQLFPGDFDQARRDARAGLTRIYRHLGSDKELSAV